MDENHVFLENIRTIYKDQGVTWLQSLPSTIAWLASRWGFRYLNPVPDLSYSFVGLVQRNLTGQTAILKIAPPAQGLGTGLRWSKAHTGVVPEIFEYEETYNAVLMEHLVPGDTLKDLVQKGKDDKATKIICNIVKELQLQKTKVTFAHISTLAHSFEVLKGRFDEALRSKAVSLFEDLTKDRKHDVPLHGDLHHANILSSGDQWKVIDPHGYTGDPVAELAAMIRNPYDCFPKERSLVQTFERRLHILADETGFEKQRIKDWCFCITVLSAAWTFEGYGTVTDSEKAFADALDRAKI